MRQNGHNVETMEYMPREITYVETETGKYVPEGSVPVFRLKRPEKELDVKDFYLTAVIINNCQAVGRWYLVLPWVMLILIPLILMAAAVDIALFLVVKYFFLFVWKVLTESATGIVGKAAKVLGIAAAIFLVFVFIRSGVWEKYYEELLKVLGW